MLEPRINTTMSEAIDRAHLERSIVFTNMLKALPNAIRAMRK